MSRAPGLVILSWNINGVRAAARKGLLDWLKKARPDVLCLQETKALPEQLPPELLDIDGYQAHWNPAIQKGYSGVAGFSKIQPLDVEKGLGINAFDVEGRVLAMTFPDFLLFNVYFPNGKRSPERLKFKMDFYEAFLKHLAWRRSQGQDRIIICGDVNTAHMEIDLARPRENRKISGFLPEECAWISSLVQAGFIDTFREFEKGPGHYSWWDQQSRARERNVGWRIDYFFISENLRPRLKNAFLLPEVMGSDHCPVGIELQN